jgi:flagellar hook protein FlgE
MLKSMYSGVSGMKGFQTKLDVIGNNIANVNTVGFKKSRVMFQDIISQNVAGAVPSTAQSGGENPKQIGLGNRIGTIDTVHTPGSPMTTNIGTDLAIDGDAFFLVTPDTPESNGKQFLTKAGNFTRDGEGNLVNANGFFVTGVKTTAAGPEEVSIKIIKDELTDLKFTSFAIDTNGFINVVNEEGENGKLAMDADGKYYMSKDTNADENISIATVVVTNPGGLQKLGNSMYEETGNSGYRDLGRIEDIKGGKMNAGLLEMSNVDLTDEFTEMIVAQRGFQANARIITTSDSILEEVVNLKR